MRYFYAMNDIGNHKLPASIKENVLVFFSIKKSTQVLEPMQKKSSANIDYCLN